MKQLFKTGDIKVYTRIVADNDKVTFESGTVHNVYSTFCLTRDAEWSTRLFVLEMKEDDEEGIGTFVEVIHKSPALIGSVVNFGAVIESINGHEIICSFTALVGDRIIATGRTGQKILKKEKLGRLMKSLEKISFERQ